MPNAFENEEHYVM